MITLYDQNKWTVKRQIDWQANWKFRRLGRCGIENEDEMIVETTNYFAKMGQADAVLEQRRKACALRVEMGLDPGTVLIKLDGDGPDIRWDCTFATREAYEADMAARAALPAFAAARREMHLLLTRFERHLNVSDQVTPGLADCSPQADPEEQPL